MLFRGDGAMPRELAEALRPFVDEALERRGYRRGAGWEPFSRVEDRWDRLLACFEGGVDAAREEEV